MTTPAATAALETPLDLALADWENHRDFGSGTDFFGERAAPFILAHPFTDAERAALAAVLLTPEVLAEALDEVDVESGTMSVKGIARAILATLAARGAA